MVYGLYALNIIAYIGRLVTSQQHKRHFILSLLTFAYRLVMYLYARVVEILKLQNSVYLKSEQNVQTINE